MPFGGKSFKNGLASTIHAYMKLSKIPENWDLQTEQWFKLNFIDQTYDFILFVLSFMPLPVNIVEFKSSIHIYSTLISLILRVLYNLETSLSTWHMSILCKTSQGMYKMLNNFSTWLQNFKSQYCENIRFHGALIFVSFVG